MPVIDKENFKDYKAVIADSPDVNAFAQCEDKLVIVFAGAFDEFTTDEMHFIMAHEFSHISLEHCQSATGVSVTLNILRFIPKIGGLANLIVNPLVTRAYMRENEYEADEKAVTALISIGMNPQAAVTALEKLRAIAKANDISEEEDRTGLLDTHPNLTARIEAVKKQIEKEFQNKKPSER
ncbi:MAG: hypothetical protein A2077_01255 [Nitrospirae bacterium GWC2_46_6]|nr:MAG: hypothetical protein A2077_01255 [Nitrospirae bacterium GWC2_46_6]OGW21133.1 MAG: hypothetical protein A2Z82_00765 [Nitrospirae bacterium GWA2_46_11]OGW23822.1 MAG: hypothetical protein A2X55_11970 [Nitrospirae bacterium GWB2_47_37]